MQRIVMKCLDWYQAYRSVRPAACRYLPTCSAYASQAVAEHGTIRGLWFAARRVGRCHPLGSHGYDPVPPSRSAVVRTSTVASSPVVRPRLVRKSHA